MRYYIPYVETDDATGFKHYYTGSKLEFPYWLDWYAGPDPTRAPVTDDTRKVLLSYYGFGGEYKRSYIAGSMTYSGLTYCVTCKIEHNYLNSTYINLRGLCSETKFDQVFIPRFGADNLLMYYGNFDTIIEYDLSRDMWVMNLTYTASKRAESSSSYGSLALGNIQWTVYNDTKCTQNGETITLTLSTCTTNQFTCNDGHCIEIDLR